VLPPFSRLHHHGVQGAPGEVGTDGAVVVVDHCVEEAVEHSRLDPLLKPAVERRRLPNWSGMAFHWQLVFRRKMIPSRVRRLSVRGRPPSPPFTNCRNPTLDVKPDLVGYLPEFPLHAE
jgi:hypothetical protein